MPWQFLEPDPQTEAPTEEPEEADDPRHTPIIGQWYAVTRNAEDPLQPVRSPEDRDTVERLTTIMICGAAVVFLLLCGVGRERWYLYLPLVWAMVWAAFRRSG